MTETIRLTIPEMLERFKSLGEKLGPTAYVAMLVSGQKMLRDVVKNRMSNPRRGSTSTNLGVDTGTARRSMTDLTQQTERSITTLIGSTVDYVRSHEEGFHGPVQVRAHTRRIAVLERNTHTGRVSKASSRKYKAALRSGRKTSAHVRAYTRKVNILAKHFIRDTVIANVVPTTDRITRALLIAVKTGKVPQAGQLGA